MDVAVIVTSPSLIVVTLPVASTVATSSSDDVHTASVKPVNGSYGVAISFKSTVFSGATTLDPSIEKAVGLINIAKFFSPSP